MSLSENHQFMFTWHVQNFSFFFKKIGEFIESPIFAPDCLGGSQWQMMLNPNDKSKECENLISLYLKRYNDQSSEETISIDEMCEVFNPDDTVLLFDEVEDISYEKNQIMVIAEFDKKRIDKQIKDSKEDKLVIQLYLRKSQPQLYSATTEVVVDHCFFQWVMANINSPDWLESKTISVFKSQQFLINITAPEDYVLIKIKKSDINPPNSLFILCKVSLVDIDGTKVKSKTRSFFFDASSSNNTFQFPSFIKKSYLEFETNNITKDGNFTLDWEFSCTKGEESNLKDYFVPSLTNDLKNMFNNQKYCDVQLRCKDVMLPAHKFILASRSVVFDAMFSQDMTESNTGVVDIVDADPDSLKIFLGYLYDDVLDLSDSETVLKVLLLAEKYQVLTLKEHCCSYLIPKLTADNVCETFAVGDMIGHQRLKSAAMRYLRTNAKKALSSPERHLWAQNNPKLANELICYLSEIIRKQEDSEESDH